MNEATRTIKVRADIQNPLVSTNPHPRRLFRFGMYAEGRVGAKLENILAVPRSAILSPGAVAYAYVDKGGGAYARRRVKLGRQGDEYWEVLRGLEEGERVVTSGNVLIDAQAQFNQGADEASITEESDASEPGDVLPAMAEAHPEANTWVLVRETRNRQLNRLTPKCWSPAPVQRKRLGLPCPMPNRPKPARLQ